MRLIRITSYILLHKLVVGYYLCKARLYKQALLHDNDKLINIFSHSNIGSENYYNERLKHRETKPHHFEHWFSHNGSKIMLKSIPYNYLVEMAIDWTVANKMKQRKESTIQEVKELEKLVSFSLYDGEVFKKTLRYYENIKVPQTGLFKELTSNVIIKGAKCL